PRKPTAEYSKYRARIRLVEGEDLVGSYLQVPIATIDDLILAVGNPTTGTVANVDGISLCYVGIDRAPDGKTRHLFEWGYGWLAEIGPEFLRFKGRPIEEGELVLAFGDWIKSIRLMSENGVPILSIEDTDLAPAHVLYRQAGDRILHVLSVSSSSPEDAKIDRLEGFDSRGLAAEKSIVRPFPNIGAVLDSRSARGVASLLAQTGNTEPSSRSISVYGRLDREIYRQSGGMDVVYRAIHVGSENTHGFDVLTVGDRIFVRAKQVRQMRNDLALAVVALSTIERVGTNPAAEMEGRHSTEWLITRRRYSYDESALGRAEADDNLKDRVLLVRLEARAGQQGGFDLVHRDGAPPRRAEL